MERNKYPRQQNAFVNCPAYGVRIVRRITWYISHAAETDTQFESTGDLTVSGAP